MSEQKVYGAVAMNGKYVVARKHNKHGLSWHPVGDIRDFCTFEQADECARRVAAGEFEQWEAGQYVNMR